MHFSFNFIVKNKNNIKPESKPFALLTNHKITQKLLIHSSSIHLILGPLATYIKLGIMIIHQNSTISHSPASFIKSQPREIWLPLV